MTAEPRVEDLLASIRRAIHEDIGEVPSSATGDTFHGSMNELRVRVGDEVTAAAAEIQDLRQKISRTRENTVPVPPPVRRPVFEPAGTQDADTNRLRRRLEASSQSLRPSFAEAEINSIVESHLDGSRRFSREAETIIPATAPPGSGTSILSLEASAAASSAFNRLADSILSRSAGDRSVEDMTRELLRGMLKQWLDENLPALVERLVREEIERVARRGR